MSVWDEHAKGWDDDTAVQAYADATFASLIDTCAAIGFDLRGTAACDFGCGTGLLTSLLAERCSRIDAIDTSSAMLEVLRDKIERHGWHHVRAGPTLAPEAQQYDVIVCSSVLSFVDDYPAMVRQLAGHLLDRGLFVQWDWERDVEHEAAGGLMRDEIHEALTAAQLAGVEVGIGFEVSVDGEVMRPLMGHGRKSLAVPAAPLP